jgi:hypothetical protein
MSAVTRVVIGIDPGPTPGIVLLARRYSGDGFDADVVQCSASALLRVLEGLDPHGHALISVERFVVKGRNNAAQSLTRDQVSALQALFPRVVLRTAAQVKPWATDTRLEAAGLLEATKGMRHARDAARHALFCAVHDAGVPDPLSRKATR